jgi:4-hydroxy-tetrahydrodipicolinate reductase
MKTHIAINGACGRMGQRIIAFAHEDSDLLISAAVDSPNHPAQGKDAGELAGIGPLGVPVRTSLAFETQVDVVIDFSIPEGTSALLAQCTGRKIPLVIATTGHTPAQREEIEAAAHQTAILLTANFSLVVNVLFKLVKDAASMLADKGFDVEIIERHHRYKKDSPSGTAMHFAKIIQQAMGQTDFRHGREGLIGERPLHEIGIHAVRAGDNVGEHAIIFSTLGETMELIHKGHSRDSYARGALLAAKFLAGKGAGRYAMSDVLGI